MDFWNLMTIFDRTVNIGKCFGKHLPSRFRAVRDFWKICNKMTDASEVIRERLEVAVLAGRLYWGDYCEGNTVPESDLFNAEWFDAKLAELNALHERGLPIPHSIDANALELLHLSYSFGDMRVNLNEVGGGQWTCVRGSVGAPWLAVAITVVLPEDVGLIDFSGNK